MPFVELEWVPRLSVGDWIWRTARTQDFTKNPGRRNEAAGGNDPGVEQQLGEVVAFGHVLKEFRVRLFSRRPIAFLPTVFFGEARIAFMQVPLLPIAPGRLFEMPLSAIGFSGIVYAGTAFLFMNLPCHVLVAFIR